MWWKEKPKAKSYRTNGTEKETAKETVQMKKVIMTNGKRKRGKTPWGNGSREQAVQS